jgi:lysosomal Pro-X carboxypeptidase
MPAGDKLRYLTPDQALADYAVLIEQLRNGTAKDSAIIGFGGSYGGLLTAWMRAKYPWALDGGLASSAPIALFNDNLEGISMVTTQDASASRGATPHCEDNIRSAFAAIPTLSTADLRAVFQSCQAVKAEDVPQLMLWLESAMVALAQSSFPFESDLLLLGAPGMMPAYPLQAACSIIGGGTYPDNKTLLKAVVAGVSLYYNASGSQTCNDISRTCPDSAAGIASMYLWGYIGCTVVPTAGSANGVTDMFFPAKYTNAGAIAGCRKAFGENLEPNFHWVSQHFGGGANLVATASNLIVSNGQYDPVIAGGVTDSSNPSVQTIVFDALGHTGDLAWSNPNDSNATTTKRAQEVQTIGGWIRAHQKRSK